MPISITPTRVGDPQFGWFDGSGAAGTVRRVVDAAAREDGADPLDEAALLALRHGLGSTSMWVADDSGFAWRHDRSLDVVVDPAARGRGLGSALASVASRDDGPLTAWSHGNHPAAAVLAARLGFERVRDLWVMRRPLASLPPLPASTRGADGVDVRTFRVGEDEEAFLALNAEAFAHHPEQGGLTRADLDERIAEPWFDPDGFFVAARGAELVGFHWTKVHGGDGPHHPEAPHAHEGHGHDPIGEVYVVGVDPGERGTGLGRALTVIGLRHLRHLGLPDAMLYVDADNTSAIRLYKSLGFTRWETDVMFSRDPA
jgi:mycothiol synthase